MLMQLQSLDDLSAEQLREMTARLLRHHGSRLPGARPP